MSLKKATFYSWIFGITLLLQIFLPSFRTNMLLQIGLLAIFFTFEQSAFSRYFLKFLYPLLALFFIGFIGTALHKYDLFNLIKDIFHFIKPVLGITIGYLLFKKIGDFKVFIRTIVICALVSAMIHMITLIVTGNLFSGSLNDVREFGKDSFLELFGLIFIGFYKRFTGSRLFESRRSSLWLFLFILISALLYFSRTMIVTTLLILLTIYGYTVITKRTLRIIAVGITGMLLLYTYLYSVKIERDKPGIEAFLYKLKMAPAEIFTTRINRENHKELWDHWRGYEMARAFDLMNENPESYIVGCGHGSLVNLRFYAPLTGDIHDKGMKYISELHNGYMYVFYKTGLMGLCCYLLLLARFYKAIRIKKTAPFIMISAIGLFFFFTTLTITGLYNFGDIVIFILGGLIAFSDKERISPLKPVI